MMIGSFGGYRTKKKKEEGNQDIKQLQVIPSVLKQGAKLPLIKVLRLEMKTQLLGLEGTGAAAAPEDVF